MKRDLQEKQVAQNNVRSSYSAVGLSNKRTSTKPDMVENNETTKVTANHIKNIKLFYHEMSALHCEI